MDELVERARGRVQEIVETAKREVASVQRETERLLDSVAGAERKPNFAMTIAGDATYVHQKGRAPYITFDQRDINRLPEKPYKVVVMFYETNP